jgi:CxxC-x17-CxxC domain-containing protein
MAFEDKTIVCCDCGEQFVHSVADQEAFAQKGHMNAPKRCNACRDKRRASRPGGAAGASPSGAFSGGGGYSGGGGGYGGGGGFGAPRQMYQATCAECGQACQVPFQPRQDRPVYCSACYSKQRGASGGGGRSGGSRY